MNIDFALGETEKVNVGLPERYLMKRVVSVEEGI
jgi:hypothetical protein